LQHLGIHGRDLQRPDYSLRAFDKDSIGTTCGDGGSFLIFESLESANKRGVPIIAEVIGDQVFFSGSSPLQPTVEGIQRMFYEIG